MWYSRGTYLRDQITIQLLPKNFGNRDLGGGGGGGGGGSGEKGKSRTELCNEELLDKVLWDKELLNQQLYKKEVKN